MPPEHLSPATASQSLCGGGAHTDSHKATVRGMRLCTALVFQVEKPFGAMRALFSKASIQDGRIRLQGLGLETSLDMLCGSMGAETSRGTIPHCGNSAYYEAASCREGCITMSGCSLHPRKSKLHTNLSLLFLDLRPPDSVTHRPCVVCVGVRGARIGNCRDGS